jgi:hypothetical protein
MGSDTLIVGHGAGPLPSAQRCTSRDHDSIGAGSVCAPLHTGGFASHRRYGNVDEDGPSSPLSRARQLLSMILHNDMSKSV